MFSTRFCFVWTLALMLLPVTGNRLSGQQPVQRLTIERNLQDLGATPGALIASTGTQFATATLVRHHHAAKNQDFWFVVGAYHTIYKASEVKYGDINISPKMSYVDKIFCDTIADVFVVKLKNNPGLEAWGLHEPRVSEGMAANAVGNPAIPITDEGHVSETYPLNITYSCTISQQAPAELRFQASLFRKGIEKELNKEERARANNMVRIFIETLSIDRGFSGGPVITPPLALLVAAPNVVIPTPDKKVFGIVVAGTPEVFAGRYAVVCRSNEIIEAIRMVNDEREPQTSTKFYIKDDFGVHKNWPVPPYRLGYAQSDRIQVNFKGAKVTAKEFIELLEDYRQRAAGDLPKFLSARNARFENVDFGKADLSDVVFEECEFAGKTYPFYECLTPGLEFRRCTFEDALLAKVTKNMLLSGRSVKNVAPIKLSDKKRLEERIEKKSIEYKDVKPPKSPDKPSQLEKIFGSKVSAEIPQQTAQGSAEPAPADVDLGASQKSATPTEGDSGSPADPEVPQTPPNRLETLRYWKEKLEAQLPGSAESDGEQPAPEDAPKAAGDADLARLRALLAHVEVAMARELLLDSGACSGRAGTRFSAIRKHMERSVHLLAEIADDAVDDHVRLVLRGQDDMHREVVVLWLGALSPQSSLEVVPFVPCPPAPQRPRLFPRLWR